MSPRVVVVIVIVCFVVFTVNMQTAVVCDGAGEFMLLSSSELITTEEEKALSEAVTRLIC